MKYSDVERIKKIKRYTGKLIEYVHNNKLTRDLINRDETIQWTLTTPLYNIGEHAYYLSEEFRKDHSDIPWAKISGLRHRLVHDYEDTNWNIICDIIFDVLPEFQKQLDELDSEER